MLKLVRRSTFETNSSSCHSVVLLAKDLPKTKSQSKEILLSLDEFGWGTDIVTNEGTKLDYLFTYVVNYGSDNDKELFVSKLKEYYPNLSLIRTPLGSMNLNQFSKALDKSDFNDKLSYSYIDHESVSVARNVLHSMSLSDYLSNKCTLYVTNDNVDNFCKIDVKLANKLGITQEVAESIAEENSSGYYITNPYELNRDLKNTIIALGGQVID